MSETFGVIRGWFRSLYCIGLQFFFFLSEIWDLCFLLRLDSFIRFEHPASSLYPWGSVVRVFAAPLGGGVYLRTLASCDIRSRRLFFSCLSHTRSDFVDDGLGLSCCFWDNVMSCHISWSYFCRRIRCGIQFTFFLSVRSLVDL